MELGVEVCVLMGCDELDGFVVGVLDTSQKPRKSAL